MIAVTNVTAGEDPTSYRTRAMIAELSKHDDVIGIAGTAEVAEAVAADLDIPVRFAAPMDSDAWPGAFEGVDKMLLLFSIDVGNRVPHHKNAIDGAVRAGVGHLVYLGGIDTRPNNNPIFEEHDATDELIRKSGVPYTLLHHNIENETGALIARLAVEDDGVIIGCAGQGRTASASDFSDKIHAVNTVLTTPGHENKEYNLNGTSSWTYYELADMASEILGTEIVYQDMSHEEHYQACLELRGTPRAARGLDHDLPVEVVKRVAFMWSTMFQMAADGTLAGETSDYPALIGRDTTPLRATLEERLADLVPN